MWPACWVSSAIRPSLTPSPHGSNAWQSSATGSWSPRSAKKSSASLTSTSLPHSNTTGRRRRSVRSSSTKPAAVRASAVPWSMRSTPRREHAVACCCFSPPARAGPTRTSSTAASASRRRAGGLRRISCDGKRVVDPLGTLRADPLVDPLRAGVVLRRLPDERDRAVLPALLDARLDQSVGDTRPARGQRDGQTGRQTGQALEREQYARNERLARERVVTDRQELAVAAEQDLLVRDEAWETNRVDRRIPAERLGRGSGSPGRRILLRLVV